LKAGEIIWHHVIDLNNFSLTKKETLVKLASQWVSGKEGCKEWLEPASVYDILYSFGLEHFIFIGEKSGKFEK